MSERFDNKLTHLRYRNRFTSLVCVCVCVSQSLYMSGQCRKVFIVKALK